MFNLKQFLMAKLWNASSDVLKSVEKDNPFFGNLLTEAFGGSWRNSSEYEDKFLHIDIFFQPEGKEEYGIDIKTMSKIQRHDKSPDPNIQYIQVTTKTGDHGALFGQSKYFGFINSNGHLLTPMENVRMFYESIVDPNKIVYKNPRSENILYQRQYRNSDGEMVCPPEKIYLMRYQDLKCLSEYTFDSQGKPVELPALTYGIDWVKFYIETIKKEYKKKGWGIQSDLYTNPNEIFRKFKESL